MSLMQTERNVTSLISEPAAAPLPLWLVIVIGSYFRRMGVLPAAPDKRECQYCDYRRVCGPYEEMRVRHKIEAKQVADLAQVDVKTVRAWVKSGDFPKPFRVGDFIYGSGSHG